MQKYYRFIHSSEEVRKNSSSGGAFTLISDLILDLDGVIYGCILDEKLQAIHVRAITKPERDKMKGSKYVQSDMRVTLSQVKNDLENGKHVLFTGTPCQVFSVLQFLQVFKVETTNLILLELICHGVGSRKFFDDYLEHLEEKYKGKAVSVNFRAKQHKGQKQDMKIQFDNGKVYKASSTKFDWFYSVYLKNLILRPSCYECLFSKKERYADLTIADHWGYQDSKSYSLIVSNTPKGEKLLGMSIDEKLKEILETEIKQSHMIQPCRRPDKRDFFWNMYLSQGYLAVQRWLGNNTIKGKIKDQLARAAYTLHIASVLKKITGRG